LLSSIKPVRKYYNDIGLWKNMFCAFAAWNMEKHVPLLTLCLSCLQGGASGLMIALGSPPSPLAGVDQQLIAGPVQLPAIQISKE
jgi:hypothetical protein